MTRELDLKRRLTALSGLRDAVGAMKSLSAHHFRETRSVALSAREYRAGVESIVARVGCALRPGSGPVGLIVVGAELGLCGGYTSRVVEKALERLAETGPGPCFCVGKRTRSLLERRGVEVSGSYPGPSGVRELDSLLLGLAERLLRAFVEQDLSALDVVSSHFAGVGSQQPKVVRLLPAPFDTNDPELPLYSRLDDFITAATREYLFSTLFEILVNALASEHGARLLATEGAERWLEERVEHLQRRLTVARREASTQETIELSARRA
ncbi:MAG: F0F1 ATP synthase subunit gamma [Myxococcales bacterium]|nr:F0F1 ATP synthase subunit gamma [Myxococcales bacterium]